MKRILSILSHCCEARFGDLDIRDTFDKLGVNGVKHQL